MASVNSTLLYNLRCCIATLAYKNIMKELNGKISLKDLQKIHYLRAMYCSITDDECFTEEEIDLIIEQINSICGCCNCGPRNDTDASNVVVIVIEETEEEEEMAACTQIEEEFTNLQSGNTVTITATPCDGYPIDVYRNGLHQDNNDEYSMTGTVVTFVTDFQISSGGSEGESVLVKYYKQP